MTPFQSDSPMTTIPPERDLVNAISNLTINDGQAIVGNQFGGDSNTFNFNYSVKSVSTDAAFKCHYTFRQSRTVKSFVGREEHSLLIERQLSRNELETDPHMPRCVVMYGLGGSGKTQLALPYLQQKRSTYDATLWVSAASADSFRRDVRNIYCQLYDKHEADAALPSNDRMLASVREKLERHTGRVLLIFDSADSIEDIGQSDTAVDITEALPTLGSVDVLITSRSSAASHLATGEAINISIMSLEQSVNLFQKLARCHEKPGNTYCHIKEIVEELGMLPLAIAIAAAYISETPRLRNQIENFLTEFRAKKTGVIARQPRWIIDYYPANLLTTWETSFEAIEQRVGDIASFLGICGCLSPDDIALSLFTEEDHGGDPRLFWKDPTDDSDDDSQTGDSEKNDKVNVEDTSAHYSKAKTSTAISSCNETQPHSVLSHLHALPDSGALRWQAASSWLVGLARSNATSRHLLVDDHQIRAKEPSNKREKPVNVLYAKQWWEKAYSFTEPSIFQLEELFAALESFGLIYRHEDGNEYSMHHPVHAWAFERMAKSEQQSWTAAALDLVAWKLKKIDTLLLSHSKRLRLERHFGHMVPLIERAWKPYSNRESAALLLNAIRSVFMAVSDGDTYTKTSAYKDSSRLMLDIATTHPGLDHTSHALGLVATANICFMNYDYARAETLYETALRLDCREVMDDDENFCDIYMSYALILCKLGKTEEVLNVFATNAPRISKIEGKLATDLQMTNTFAPFFSLMYSIRGQTQKSNDLHWKQLDAIPYSAGDFRRLNSEAALFHDLVKEGQLTQRHDARLAKLVADCQRTLGPTDPGTAVAEAAITWRLQLTGRFHLALEKDLQLLKILPINEKQDLHMYSNILYSSICSLVAMREYGRAMDQATNYFALVKHQGLEGNGNSIMAQAILEETTWLTQCWGRTPQECAQTPSAKQHEEGVRIRRQIYERVMGQLGPCCLQTIQRELALLESVYNTGDFKEAVEIARDCAMKLEETLSPDAAMTLDTRLLEAEIQDKLKAPKEASKIRQKVLKRLKFIAAGMTGREPDVYEFEKLAAISQKLGDRETVVATQEAFVEEALTALGADDELTRSAQAELARMREAGV